ncbi:hypothetical protein HB779_17290 [Phyllobacterium sp. 628]|uniref:hypothetical protein n=1 Tax=Phyllobacterium sp. 628 TaxID=2718938 RepID=UPI0016624D76|nr:hypothetical protein [Phyllobacterium sp. 628]QND53445.1 hypothetical protein HB779_17290 [Phyllobacterium sp. 628]
MPLDQDAKNFWSAAYFYRLAPDRNRSMAIKILEHVRNTGTGKAQASAAALLKDIENVTDNSTADDGA